MYRTGEEPRSCTEQDGCPVHVLDRLGTQFMYRKGWCPGHVLERVVQVMFWKGLPRSCSKKGGCPGHVLGRVAQVMF